jgi:hypothetical protein
MVCSFILRMDRWHPLDKNIASAIWFEYKRRCNRKVSLSIHKYERKYAKRPRFKGIDLKVLKP